MLRDLIEIDILSKILLIVSVILISSPIIAAVIVSIALVTK